MFEVIIQGVFVLIMFKIIRWTIKSGRNAIFYWFIIALYLLAAIWLMLDFFSTPDGAAGGGLFVIEMYAMIVPSVLALTAGLVFFVIYFISLGPKKK